MKKLNLYTALTFLVVLAFFSIASGDGSVASAQNNNGWRFGARLTGEQEVPPVETETTGRARLRVNQDRTEIQFHLEVRRAVDVFAVAGAHIHCAPPGENGPVILFLAGAVPGGLDGRVRAAGTLSDANIVDTSCGSTISEIVDSMLAGNTYVNVHSAAHPGGVVRGQIHLGGR